MSPKKYWTIGKLIKAGWIALNTGLYVLKIKLRDPEKAKKKADSKRTSLPYF